MIKFVNHQDNELVIAPNSIFQKLQATVSSPSLFKFNREVKRRMLV